MATLWHCFVVTKLTPAQIKIAQTAVPEWRRTGAVIRRTFVFKDFVLAMKFVATVARLAERAWHHPDIDIRWNKVTLALTTHDAGGLSTLDVSLAQRIEQLVSGIPSL